VLYLEPIGEVFVALDFQRLFIRKTDKGDNMNEAEAKKILESDGREYAEHEIYGARLYLEAIEKARGLEKAIVDYVLFSRPSQLSKLTPFEGTVDGLTKSLAEWEEIK
jgi:hypothetical protein